MKTVSSLFGAGLQLAVIAGGLLLGQPLPAAVTLTVTPAAITNDFSGKIKLDVTGLTAGQTVRIEKYLDLNGNGSIDALEFPIQSFTVTDGQLPLIGGIRNPNVAGDDDGAADGQLRVKLFHPWVDNVVDTAPGNFIYRVSDPTNGFSPVTQTFSVAQKVLPQGVTGTVSLGGIPAPYTSVGLFPQNAPGGRLVFADSGGHYVIYAPPGNYGLAAFGNGVFASPSGVTVNTNQFLTNNPGLIAGTLTVSGAVTNTADGKGIPSVFIVAQSTNNAIAGGWTDASGHYSLQVTPGLWELRPMQSSLAQVGYVGPDQRLQTNLAGAATINFAVLPATALIYGTLQATSNTPLPGIELDANQQSGPFYSQGRSFPPDGAYALGVVAGTWDVGPSSDDPGLAGFAGVQSSTVTLTNGQAQRLDFTVQSFTAHLRGQAVDNTGAPVANLTLGVSPPNGGNWSSSTQTGPDGSFDLGLFGGTWYLGFDTEGAAALGLVCPSITVVVTDGVDQNGLLLVLQKVTGQITGYVKDSGNRPVANVGVYAYATLSGTSYSQYMDADNNGNYALAVANGSWNVGVNCSGGSDDLASRGYQCVGEQTAIINSNNAVVNFTVQPCPPLQVTTTSPLPDGQVGSYYSFQLQAAGCYEPFNWSLAPGSAALPPNLNLATDGTLSGTPTAPGAYSFYVRVTDTASHTADQLLSLSISPGAPLQVTTTWLPGGTNGLFCNWTLGAAGGQPPYTWSLSPGSADLPPNLALGANGVIFGTPLTNGTFYFFVRVTDAALATADQRLALTIAPAPLQITNTALPNGLVGVAYSARLGATGGQPPYYWSLALGSANLPPGLSLDATGLIWGTPLTNGTFNFFVQVTDANYASVSRSFGMVITARPTLSLPARPLARQFQFQVNGVAGQTCTIQVSTNLSSPNWLTLLVTNAPVNSFLVLDPAATNRQRFYRVKLGP
ncbi:MAG: Ig domain-containing protein [Verrucomicrobiota bacterium]